jgi:hypothetical protein
MEEEYISILNKIKHKPFIIETILPFCSSRIIILNYLISNDKYLKNRLKKIFSKVYIQKNKLGSEFDTNMENYSIVKNIIDILNKNLNGVKSKYMKYEYLTSELNYSVINYLYKSIKEYKNIYYYFHKIEDSILKQLTEDFYSSLNEVSLTLLSNENNYLDLKYLNYIEKLNNNSKPKNKINQKVKLILLFDDNEFYYRINCLVKYSHISELEIIFKDNKINKNSLFNNLNLYLSNIEHLENINKILFHNIGDYDYLTENNNKEKNNDLYQSLLGYLFDEYYLGENDHYQIKLMQNIKEVNIEDITFLYIYEKMKIY